MTGGGGTLKILKNDTFRYSKYNDIFFFYLLVLFFSRKILMDLKKMIFLYIILFPLKAFKLFLIALIKKYINM